VYDKAKDWSYGSVQKDEAPCRASQRVANASLEDTSTLAPSVRQTPPPGASA